MFLPITKSALIAYLAFIPFVWPETTQSSNELSLAGNGEDPQNGEECRTGTGNTGICMQSDDCKHSNRTQSGNCVGFLDICCPKMDKVIRREGCGRRRPSGLGDGRIFTRGREREQGELIFAHFGEFPWMVSILTNEVSDKGVWNDKTFQGSGTLIAPRAVLTAAHLVKDFQLKGTPLKVRAGVYDIDKNEYYGYIESSVQQSIIHEHFNKQSLTNDIALLILKEPINANMYIGYACLPAQNQAVPIVEDCFVTGWGKDSDDRKGRLQHKMKKNQLAAIPHDECQERMQSTILGPIFNLDSSFVCAGDGTNADSCLGDGGSPLVCPISSGQFRYMLHGVLSWGLTCKSGVPGVYVDVADYRNWIDTKMEEVGFDTSTYNFF